MAGPQLGGTEGGDRDLALACGGRRRSWFGTPVRGGGAGLGSSGAAFRQGSGRPGAPPPGETFRPGRDLAAKREAYAEGAPSGTLRRPVRAWDDDLDAAGPSGAATGPSADSPSAARPARPIIPGDRQF